MEKERAMWLRTGSGSQSYAQLPMASRGLDMHTPDLKIPGLPDLEIGISNTDSTEEQWNSVR